MSVLDSSIAQIIASDGDQRRRKRIDYISQKPPEVRAALLMDVSQSTTIPPDAARQAALQKLAVGFPQSGFQVDQTIDVKDGAGDPLGEMESRQQKGFAWIPAIGMDPLPIPAGGEPTADPAMIPPGAIIVTTNFDTPAPDLILKTKPFRWLALAAPGADRFAVGAAYWPLDDNSQELSVWYGAGNCKFQKLSVIGYMGATNLLWVRLV